MNSQIDPKKEFSIYLGVVIQSLPGQDLALLRGETSQEIFDGAPDFLRGEWAESLEFKPDPLHSNLHRAVYNMVTNYWTKRRNFWINREPFPVRSRVSTRLGGLA